MLARLATLSRLVRGERLLTRAVLSNFFAPYNWLKLPSRESLAIAASQESQKQRWGHRNLTIMALVGAGVMSPLFLREDHAPWELESALRVECSTYQDKYLNSGITRIDKGINELQYKYPGMKRTIVQGGIRGSRYYVEFPISGRKVDEWAIIEELKKKINERENIQFMKEDPFKQNDSFAFSLDYKVPSDSALGSKHNGSLYLRGISGTTYDQFKFSLEKEVEFSDLDVELVLTAYEAAFRPKHDEMDANSVSGEKESNRWKKWQRRGSAKDAPGAAAAAAQGGQKGADDPQTVLEQAGCTVFIPGVKKNELDWNYLAGYDQVKRDIEDTVLLALTHGHIYDQITSKTRMKNETNRPKCVLFEGPPGCGKTTSAKILAQQVNIPLVYMPLEAIMSKYYGESENRLAEIFEAAKALGRVILFIDEVDSLATSREAGLHEATRRILSTLLRKIDSFESDGEVLVICATNRKKDLDPALVSRLDLSVRFDLPDPGTRGLIFQRYAKQLTQDELKKLGELAEQLSGRDIADICKDAERRWASKFIRKETQKIEPQYEMYEACTHARVKQMENVNLRMDKARPLF